MPTMITGVTDDALAAFAEQDATRPMAAMNLFALRERAVYAPEDPEFGTDAADVSGAEALDRYVAETVPLIVDIGGRPVFGTRVEQVFVGPDAAQWDRAAVLWFPTRQAFADMLASPVHQAASRHRTAALANWRQFHLDGSFLTP